MTARAIVVTPAGDIVKIVTGDPAMLALQLGLHDAGDALFALDDDAGAFINQETLQVDESGDLIVREGAPPEAEAPPLTLFLITVNGD